MARVSGRSNTEASMLRSMLIRIEMEKSKWRSGKLEEREELMMHGS